MPRQLVNGSTGDSIMTRDRGLLYGDGLFETLAIVQGQPRYWLRHMARLQTGCHRLGIAPVDEALLHDEVALLLKASAGTARAVVKIIITRGQGGRGYQPDPHATPSRIVQLHGWPDRPDGQAGVRATLCSLRLGNNPQLAGIKHLNRLEQVLARAEWDDADIREGVMLDQSGRVIEGTMSNLFLVTDGVLTTPDLTRCGVAGIMRDVVLEIAEQADMPTRIGDITLDDLYQADELFVTNSLIGIWPVISIDSNRYPSGAVTTRLQRRLIEHEKDRHVWRS